MFEWLSLATVTVAGQAYPIDLLTSYPSILRGDHVFTFFDHNLVADTPASRVKVNTMLSSKLLDQAVLLQVGFGLILDVVVESHDDLTIVVDLGGADVHKLRGHWPTVVVRHAVVWGERDIVAGLDLLAGGEANRVFLDDLFGEGLGRGRSAGLLGGEDIGGIGDALELRVKGLLPSGTGGGVGAGLGRHRYGK